jgi:hypothetical protein
MLLSHCRSRQAARPTEARFPNASSSREGGRGSAVNGGLVCGCKIERRCPVRKGVPLRAKPPAAKLCVARGAADDMELITGASRCAYARSRMRCRPGENLRSARADRSAQGRVRDRRSRERRKSSAPLVDRRRPGPGKAEPFHDGAVEAVLASSSESASCVPRKDAHPVSSRDRDGDARGSVTRRRGPGENLGIFGRTRPHGVRVRPAKAN